MREFRVDAKMERTIKALAIHHGIEESAVIRRAIAMLKIASKLEDEKGAVTFMLNGRATKVVRDRT